MNHKAALLAIRVLAILCLSPLSNVNGEAAKTVSQQVEGFWDSYCDLISLQHKDTVKEAFADNCLFVMEVPFGNKGFQKLTADKKTFYETNSHSFPNATTLHSSFTNRKLTYSEVKNRGTANAHFKIEATLPPQGGVKFRGPLSLEFDVTIEFYVSDGKLMIAYWNQSAL